MNFVLPVCIVAILCLSLVVFVSRMLHNSEEFQPRRDMKRHISDEEFLAACSVKDPEVALKVREIISDQLDVPVDNIHPDDRFVQELRAD